MCTFIILAASFIASIDEWITQEYQLSQYLLPSSGVGRFHRFLMFYFMEYALPVSRSEFLSVL